MPSAPAEDRSAPCTAPVSPGAGPSTGVPDPPSPAGTTTPGIADPPLPFTGGRIAATEEERKFVERRVMTQFFVAPALSMAASLAGFNLGRPRLAAIGVIGLGLCALWIGALAIGERRLFFIRGGSMTRRQYRYFIYEGFAAVPYGLAYLVGGACLIAPALLFLNGASLERMRDVVLGRPSLALIPLGILLFCHGMGFLVGFVHRGGSTWPRVFGMLMDAPARLGGLILIAWATGLLVVGGVEWLRPELFDQWLRSIFGNPWPFTRP